MSLIDAAYTSYGEFINASTNKSTLPVELLDALKGSSQPLLNAFEFGTEINQQDPFGDTPLHAAAYKGDLLTVRYLVANGADVNALNNVCPLRPLLPNPRPNPHPFTKLPCLTLYL